MVEMPDCCMPLLLVVPGLCPTLLRGCTTRRYVATSPRNIRQLAENMDGDPDTDAATTSTPSEDTKTILAQWRDVLLILTLSVLGLYGGSGFLIPLVLAILVFVLITAVSDRVRKLWPFPGAMPVWLANLTGVASVLSGLFAIMYVLANQATQFALTFPGYEAAMDSTVTRLAALIGNDIAQGIREMIVGIDVSIVAKSAFGGARSFLTTFLLICLYVAFMMAERGVIVQKVRLAAGHGKLRRHLPGVTHEISLSLQRYVGVKTFVSALTASISYLVFRYLGLEFAETWAVLTFALNFIPSIGSFVAVLFPAAVSLVQFDSFTPFLIILIGCGSVQVAIGNFLDPALLGRSLNLSTLMVILALTFWTAVWGIPGAFLSVPLTVCLLIVFSHLPATRPLAILMSQDGSLLDETGVGPVAEGKAGAPSRQP
jgi:AI-2 transport protein TqsA